MHNIPITIADILIEVRSPLSPAELGIEKRLGLFIGSGCNAVAHMSVYWRETDTMPVPRGELIYDPGSVWRMYRSPDAFYAGIGYDDLSQTEGEALSVLRADPQWNDLRLTERRRGPGWLSRLNVGAGELTLRAKTLFTGGLVFHASGVDDNGRGIVFAGQSGVGKSTLLDLWRKAHGVIAMNDDRIVVRAAEGHASSYGTPWGGTAGIANNHRAPLAAIFLLEQCSSTEIDRLPPSSAVAPLLARAFLPYWDKDLMQRAITNLEAIVSLVPVYRLRFRPELSVIQAVRSVL